ncbi:hypothetical protein ACN4EE_08040 [Geminocystis sp. CENA526]|uniref:hypothetical protein n=1 Tax=Geminocystis sp. CENA526 TaxID=1355871 RepID=UPI003D6E3D06
MSNPDHHNLKSVRLDRTKLIKFQEWCAKNEFNYRGVIEKFIEACLENNPIIIEQIIHQKDNIDFEEKINLIINKTLQPFIQRIEDLEAQLETKKDNNSQEKKPISYSPLSTNLPQEDISKRVYLPRQQVWQRLKKTDYIKYAGYDSFLQAKGDQLIEYGIFFDDDKKRFYILDD